MEAQERRRHSRVKCEIEAVGRGLSPNSPSAPWETLVSDISEGGIRFKMNQFVPMDSRFLIKLNIPRCKPIEAVTRPAWVRELRSLNQYDVGAQFVELAREDRNLIRDYVQTPA